LESLSGLLLAPLPEPWQELPEELSRYPAGELLLALELGD
jgi:hypothetical protein